MPRAFESPETEESRDSHGRHFDAIHVEQGTRREHPLPLITVEESRFIEDTGGEYVGFVERDRGRQQFQDFSVERRAYYDPRERAVIEAFVVMEAVNNDGGSELRGPHDIAGFSVMVVRRDRAGREVGGAEVFSLQPGDFPLKDMATQDLRALGRQVQDRAIADAPEITSEELRRRITEHLQSNGWQE
jgi:hypothetical protein